MSQPPLPEDLSQFTSLVDIIARLRAPDGCPWDREQTHATLRQYLLEETYEALAALDEADAAKLCQELGDLLLQIVLQAQIARESGEFDIAAVINGIATKLVHRHPHVFGEAEVKTPEEVSHNWEALKQAERGQDASILASVPRQMPALAYSQDVQRRAAEVGFDWKDADGIVDKLAEEVREFRQADTAAGRAAEFGDLLLTLVNLARREGIDSETALREANERFVRRFQYMEDTCRQRGLTLAKLSLDEQNRLWEEAKKKVRG